MTYYIHLLSDNMYNSQLSCSRSSICDIIPFIILSVYQYLTPINTHDNNYDIEFLEARLSFMELIKCYGRRVFDNITNYFVFVKWVGYLISSPIFEEMAELFFTNCMTTYSRVVMNVDKMRSLINTRRAECIGLMPRASAIIYTLCNRDCRTLSIMSKDKEWIQRGSNLHEFSEIIRLLNESISTLPVCSDWPLLFTSLYVSYYCDINKELTRCGKYTRYTQGRYDMTDCDCDCDGYMCCNYRRSSGIGSINAIIVLLCRHVSVRKSGKYDYLVETPRIRSRALFSYKSLAIRYNLRYYYVICKECEMCSDRMRKIRRVIRRLEESVVFTD